MNIDGIILDDVWFSRKLDAPIHEIFTQNKNSTHQNKGEKNIDLNVAKI